MNRTKKAIMDTFWQLLEEKPYNKITVKNIVDHCQINRNTFYYYFHDIPELLECITKQDADIILEKYTSFDSPADCILPLVQHCLEHKKAILHIYHSVQRETFIDQLKEITLYVTTEYINHVTISSTLSLEDKKLLTHFLKCTLVGIVLDWLDAEMSYDPSAGFIRLHELLENYGR